jgi:DNA polymerase-3 subunit epsilon
MKYLFFDVETSGFINKNIPLQAKEQPHIIQLAAILADNNQTILSQINVIIKHDGLIIPSKITELTGITQAMHDTSQCDVKTAISIFNAMKYSADYRIAHNISFDNQFIAREELGLGLQRVKYEGKTICTMEATRDICGIPPTPKMIQAGFTNCKAPKLQESYSHFFGKEFEKAHDALADVTACMQVFFKLPTINVI